MAAFGEWLDPSRSFCGSDVACLTASSAEEGRVQVALDEAVTLEPDDVAIVRFLFAHYRSVKLTSISGGFSGSLGGERAGKSA